MPLKDSKYSHTYTPIWQCYATPFVGSSHTFTTQLVNHEEYVIRSHCENTIHMYVNQKLIYHECIEHFKTFTEEWWRPLPQMPLELPQMCHSWKFAYLSRDSVTGTFAIFLCRDQYNAWTHLPQAIVSSSFTILMGHFTSTLVVMLHLCEQLIARTWSHANTCSAEIHSRKYGTSVDFMWRHYQSAGEMLYAQLNWACLLECISCNQVKRCKEK